MPASRPQLPFSTLCDQHPLRIEVTPGTGSRLVISMTSVGTARHKWPPREFVRLASQDGICHVLCVTDISRSWMNGDGLADVIVDTICDYALTHGITELVGVGTSMGAFNALILGLTLPFSRIIALTPQYSVHPDIMPDEPRWKFFRKQIAQWPYPKLDALPEVPCEIVMLHGDSAGELRHWRKIPTAPNLTHFILPNMDHNFPTQLRENGDWVPIMWPAVHGALADMFTALETTGAMLRADYEFKHGVPH